MKLLHFSDPVDDELLSFAVVVARAGGKWVFCKHKDRNSYESPGGHRDKGETIEQTARRELFEETGALEFDLMPVSSYSLQGFDGVVQYDSAIHGMLYFAEIYSFGELPCMEIESVSLFDQLPLAWTYPEIQPMIMERVISFLESHT